SCLFSGLSSVATVPSGNLPNASLVGANTVNGPGLSRVCTRPAAFTAATSVVWSLELTAFCTMFLEGYIGAPPTIVVISPAADGTGPASVAMTVKVATPARRIAEMRFMVRSVLMTVWLSPGDVGSYGATRVTDARRHSHICELAAADDRACRLTGG